MQFDKSEYQKSLLRFIIESQDAERIRIGRDLHDDVGAALSGLHLIIEKFSRTPYSVESFLDFKVSVATIMDQIIKKVRNISHGLSPEIFTVNTTSEAIEELCEIVNNSDKIKIQLSNTAVDVLNKLDLNNALSIYRILEELLTNTIKHSEASEVCITFLFQREMLIVNYKDNGIGLIEGNIVEKGRGIKNIESRLEFLNATFIINKSMDTGFSILIQIPI